MAEATRVTSRTSTTRPPLPWWYIKPFRGMVNDVKRRAPYYLSDFTDAWDYRVVPSSSRFSPFCAAHLLICVCEVYMYFAKYARDKPPVCVWMLTR